VQFTPTAVTNLLTLHPKGVRAYGWLQASPTPGNTQSSLAEVSNKKYTLSAED